MTWNEIPNTLTDANLDNEMALNCMYLLKNRFLLIFIWHSNVYGFKYDEQIVIHFAHPTTYVRGLKKVLTQTLNIYI